MKITFSPLIAGASGRAADAVMSSWHGRAFVRKHVIPHNPRSALQIAQRAKLARIPFWWRSLPDTIKGSATMRALGTYGLLELIAKAFNLPAYSVFGKYNLQLLSDDEPPIIVPGNPGANPIANLTDAGGEVPNTVKLSFTAGSAILTHYVHLFTCPEDALLLGFEEPDMWTAAPTPTLVSALGILSGPLLTPLNDYYAVALVADTNNLATATVLSGGVAVVARSGAAA